MKLNIVLAATLLAASSSVLADDKVSTVTQLSSAAAFELANAAVGQCAKDGYNVSATVVDISGRVQAQLRYDNASPHTLDSSRQKAFTAVSMKQPTANLMKLVAEKPLMDPLRDMDDNLLFLAGGLPIEYKGQIVGAIGVGGAPGGHLDVICAEAAIKTVMK
ncbi:heme-binding protein [Photobacterium sanctipauli]|uniref:Heme-binding protein n=1 Tax=Photobacterium sanctipauli TaxID=1342794 RepID=A0A2T3P0L2_9GAMM|nr:heme-binding protein [Photobacterium sanctipauli]PSW22064.1 heme-binding protein [Photobacterium sanctipauli]